MKILDVINIILTCFILFFEFLLTIKKHLFNWILACKEVFYSFL